MIIIDKYILVHFPDTQKLMEHPRFNECILIIPNDEDSLDSYMCPIDLYKEIFNNNEDKSIIKPLRLGNLEFRKASYLFEEPKYPSYSISRYCPNTLYNRENEFTKVGDFYLDEETLYKYHESCFKYKETCYVIAYFDRDEDGFYELTFVGDRPIELPEEELSYFWELVKHGYNVLNHNN